MGLTRRHSEALAVFEEREIVEQFHLPHGVGRKTMADLMKAGLLEMVGPTAGLCSPGLAWRLRKTPCPRAPK